MQSPSFRFLEQGLNAAQLTQNVVANNIANVDTPYFKQSEVRFQNLLQQQLNDSSSFVGRRTDPRHFYIGDKPIDPVQPQVITDKKTAMNNNMNNVDIDQQMAMLAKNQLWYNVMIQQVNSQFKELRMAIEGK